MKNKLHLSLLCFTIHLIISGVIWGCLLVYQRGYNTLHTEEIPAASIRQTAERTHIQLLEESCSFPSAWIGEESVLYFALYAAAPEPLRFWFQVSGLVNSYF